MDKNLTKILNDILKELKRTGSNVFYFKKTELIKISSINNDLNFDNAFKQLLLHEYIKRETTGDIDSATFKLTELGREKILSIEIENNRNYAQKLNDFLSKYSMIFTFLTGSLTVLIMQYIFKLYS